MKILFDYQAFQLQKFGGISRYFYELIYHMHSDPSMQWEMPIVYSENEYLNQLSFYKGKLQSLEPLISKNIHFKNAFGGKQFRGKRKLYNLRKKLFPEYALSHEQKRKDYINYNKRLNIEALKKGDFNIFHPTFYDEYFLDYLGGKPYILTVHDLIHQIFPEYFIGNIDYVDKSRRIIEGASHIIAISENTKKDLMMIYQVPSQKITVTYLASSLDKTSFQQQTKSPVSLPNKYLLFVGHRTSYKNFYFFVQAICPLLLKDKDLYIVCTGSAFSNAEKDYLEKLGVRDKIIHLYVNDATMIYLYEHALAFVFPSLYEGFGLPVLEAFGCGCPVAVSETSSLPEVGGEAAEYFNPKNASSINEAIAKLVYDKKNREERVHAGYLQLKKFTWHNTAKNTMSIYENALSLVK